MWEDPIVAEVHRIREQLAAKFGFDVKAIFADMRTRQAALGDRLVKQKNRAKPTTDTDSACHSSPMESTSSCGGAG